jgi:hypothetical protein
LLVLPTGQILMTDFSNALEVYTPTGAPKPAWAPVITAAPANIKPGTPQTITGRQLNGLSEAGAYGDDEQSASNHPLVRVKSTSSGNVYFCNTTNETSRDISVNAVSTMTFVCPSTIPVGAASLVVVTNGIASVAKAVNVKAVAIAE